MACFQVNIHRHLISALFQICREIHWWSAKTFAFTASHIITLERDKNNPSTSLVQTVFLSHVPYSNSNPIIDYLLWKKFSESITQSGAESAVLTVKSFTCLRQFIL